MSAVSHRILYFPVNHHRIVSESNTKGSKRFEKVISNPLSRGMPLPSVTCNDSGTFLSGGERSHNASTPKEGKIKTEAACKVEDFTQDAA